MPRPAGKTDLREDHHDLDNPIAIHSASALLHPHLPPRNEFSSTSYLPRSARAVPHAQSVHTIFITKASHPLSLQPDELWIVELNSDGHETWRSIESFLGTLHVTNEPRTLRSVANQWRQHFDDVLALLRSDTSHDLDPVYSS